MSCHKESKETRADNITTGAMHLGEIASGEAGIVRLRDRLRGDGLSEGELPHVTDEQARDTVHFAQAQIALIKRVCAVELEPYREALDRLTRDACEREAAKVGMSRSAGEGVKVGDTFRWIGGLCDGLVGEVTAVQPMDALLVTGDDERWFGRADLLDASKFTRVRAVELPPVLDPSALDRAAASPSLHAALAAPAVRLVGGHEMPGGPVWGVDGAVTVGVTPYLDVSAAIPDTDQARVLEHFASLGSGVARADLDGLLDDVEQLLKAQRAWHGTNGWTPDSGITGMANLDEAIDTLALRAGQLRPSRLAGGQ